MKLLDSAGKWYKGNTHAHSTRSDGRLTPEAVARLYRDAGYDFLAITDHWCVGPAWNFEGMCVLSGAEYDFSFSGLKSAVLNYLNSCQMKGEAVNTADVAASFQRAVIDVLVEHSMDAVERYGDKKFAIAGGVASNSGLRKAFEEVCGKKDITFYHPSPIYCTDNAAMIGAAAYYEFQKGIRHGFDLNAVPNLKLGERI